ncbi:MAG TPA: S4 domain-containing protein [Steroidobacteraceae bacterium]|nr:S4 domain-containing protein [Steroidobacteraceae bacterium]
MRHRAAHARRGTAGTARAGVAAEPERLQKLLARAGLASRREAEGWIRAGRLTVNGLPATLGVRVAPGDELRLDGRLVRARVVAGGACAFLCHRSPGEDLEQALARLPRRAGRRFIAVSPMPRVDGGLELLTSDGSLARTLQRGVRALSSEFGVRVRGALEAEQLAGILGGTLDDGTRLEVERCAVAGGEAANRWYTLSVRGASGKQVRQLIERQGALVGRVLRTRLGPLALERSLGRGRARELTAEELRTLLAAG